MKELIVASTNQGKIKEIRAMLKDIDIEVLAMNDVLDDDIEIEENGTTFKENALIKAALATSPLARPPIPSQTTASITSP